MTATSLYGALPVNSASFTHLSMLPLCAFDLFGRAQKAPTIATVHLSRATNEEYVRYLPVGLPVPGTKRVVGKYRHHIYGPPTPYEWKAQKAIVTAQGIEAETSDIIEIDYLDPVQSCRPAWAASIHEATTRAPAVALTPTQTMLGMRDGTYRVADTESGALVPTNLPSDSTAMQLAARDYTCPGMALFGGVGSQLTLYNAHTNTTELFSIPADAPHKCVTTLLCVPHSHTFLVGTGSRLYIYDLLAQASPVQSVDTLYPLWPTSSMFSEQALVSWNSMTRIGNTSQLKLRAHCQTADLRAPQLWLDAPQWNVADGAEMIWSAPLDSVFV